MRLYRLKYPDFRYPYSSHIRARNASKCAEILFYLKLVGRDADIYPQNRRDDFQNGGHLFLVYVFMMSERVIGHFRRKKRSLANSFG